MAVLMYAGMDRFDVRKKIEKELDDAGLLEKVEAYVNKVGFSERTKAAIEPKLSMNKNQRDKNVIGHIPAKFKKPAKNRYNPPKIATGLSTWIPVVFSSNR